MSILDRFDFARGELPPWFAPLVSLTRPLATTLTGMIIPVGAAMCGTVAFFSEERAMAMAAASSAFLHGVPEGLYILIGSIFGVYSLSKTAEVIKAPPPAGGTSPEKPLAAEPDPPPPAAPGEEIDAAPRSRT